MSAEVARHAFDFMDEPQLGKLMTRVAKAVDERLPANTGFLVLAGPFHEGGIAQYVSNARRENCLRWMKETIRRWESGDYVSRVEFGDEPHG